MSFKLQSNVGKLTAALKLKASALVRETAGRVRNNIIDSMSETKHGTAYKKRGGEHVASAPGEAPGIDESILVGQIAVKIDNPLSARVGTNNEYAEHLEFGTSKMEPRPFMFPAFEKAKPEFEAGLKELLK